MLVEPNANGVSTSQRVVLLEAWKALESSLETGSQLSKVESMMPRVVKKRRRVDEDGSMEECALFCFSHLYMQAAVLISFHADFDLIFQDDEQTQNPASFKLLQLAHQWKLKQQQAAKEAAEAAEAGGETAEATEDAPMEA